MKNLKVLQRKWDEALSRAHAVLQAAVDRGERMTDEEQEQHAAAMAEADDLEQQINEIRDLQKIEARRRGIEIPDDPPEQHGDPKPAGQGFRNFGEFLQAVYRADTRGPVDPRLALESRAASGMSESIGPDGGYLIPDTFIADLIRRTYDRGVLASRVRMLPSAAPGKTILPAVDETSRADGSRLGGVRAYWEGEADLMTSSAPKFRRMEIDPKKLTGLCYATDELLQDAALLNAFIPDAFAEEFAFKIDDAIYNGDGAGKPLGILNSPAITTVAKETGQAAATILFENISKMWSRRWVRGTNYLWLINQEVEEQLDKLALPVGTGGLPAYLPPGGLASQPFGTLKGRPVVPIEHAAAVGTVGDIMLADLSQYVMIQRNMESATSIHVRFLYNETAFRFIVRVDGQPVWNSPLTPYKGTSGRTLSPFVVLAARS